jgi:pimeloyl-ACP methyl ester carboxylesterase
MLRRGGNRHMAPIAARLEGQPDRCLTTVRRALYLLCGKQLAHVATRRKEEAMPSLADGESVRECRLSQGTIRYREIGRGPTVVFVHGVLVNGALWREVVPVLADRCRCIVPDLPLGAHTYPLLPEAERSPRGMAQLLADFLATLELRDVILVGNNTGGAICQVTIARHPERIAGLVLTNCDAYEAFFPLLLSPFQHGARLFGARFGQLMAWLLRTQLAQRALLQLVARRRFEPATLDTYFGPFLRDAEVRHDLVSFLATMSNRDTLAAAEAFPRFPHPVLIVWGEDDIVFSARYAYRLQRDFPNATLTFVPAARACVPEDQPRRLADLIAAFIPAPVATP